jgi:hypothetical protein
MWHVRNFSLGTLLLGRVVAGSAAHLSAYVVQPTLKETAHFLLWCSGMTRLFPCNLAGSEERVCTIMVKTRWIVRGSLRSDIDKPAVNVGLLRWLASKGMEASGLPPAFPSQNVRG